MTLEVGAELELDVERLAAGGDGVAHQEGLAVFVPWSAPGDRARVRITERRRRFARAELLEVLKPGPGRREAPCRYFGTCGGCAWMHLDEPTQAQARRDLLRDALQRIGGFAELPPVEWLPSPRAFGYRARARVARAGGAVGFRARQSHAVVDVEECLVLDEATGAELRKLRQTPGGEGDVEIRGSEQPLGLQVAPSSFVQANASLWQSWVDLVAEACGAGELAVELYAGVGFYTVALERSFRSVIAVERSAAARDLRANTGAKVEHRSAEAFAEARLARLTPDLVLLNPPRAGCHRSVLDALASARPARIVYVSCDPATLARDLSSLRAAYLVRRVVAIDALPQTNSIESLVVLDT